MTNPSEPNYWEKFARDLGWDAHQVAEAGRVGSLAVARGMSAAEALDVVVAMVRDNRDVRIGPSPLQRLLRNQGVPAFVGGVAAFLAVGIGRSGESAASLFPVYFSALVATEIWMVARGLQHGRWRLSALGALMTVAAFAIFVASS